MKTLRITDERRGVLRNSTGRIVLPLLWETTRPATLDGLCTRLFLGSVLERFAQGFQVPETAVQLDPRGRRGPPTHAEKSRPKPRILGLDS